MAGWRRGAVAALCCATVLAACGDSGSTDEPEAEESPSAASATPEETPAEPAIPDDGTYRVPSEVEPGVYVGVGGPECSYQRIEDPDAKYPQVIVRGLLDRPVIEIMDGDGGFRTEGCGSWTALEDYQGTPLEEMPGDGLWLVGEDVVPGTYRGEGGDWCLWQRLDGFEPTLDSVITGGSDRKVTIEDGDLAFVTEGCGSWTRLG